MSKAFERQEVRRAKAPHICQRCQRVIPVGVRYRVFTGRTEKGFYERKECYL